MDKVFSVVYETYDYKRFKKLDCNRTLSEERKAKLLASFLANEILNPIVVNNKFEIIDGQGRYEVKKDLGLPIYYVIDADATIEDCRRMNAYNTQWSIADFCKSYADAGNKSYISLIEICDRYNLSISTVLRIINRKGGFTANNSLRDGTFILTEKDKAWVIDLIEKMNQIVNALKFTGRINDTFRTSVRIITEFEGFEYERFLKNCERFHTRFVQMSRIEDQLKVFSDIYNYRRKPENSKLYFEDYMRNRGANVRTYSKPMFKSFQPDVSTLEKSEEIVSKEGQ